MSRYQIYREHGYTDEEIQKHMRPILSAEGFDETRINQYFQNESGARPLSLAGDEQNGTVKDMGKAVAELQNAAALEGKDLGFADAVRLGWEQSVVGMLKRGKMPDELTEEEEKSLNFFERALMGAVSVAADTPVFFAGGKTGAAAGAAVGGGIGAAVGGAGAAPGAGIGAAIGGASGAFAFHAAARQMLVNMYKEGGVASFGELMDRVAAEAAKGAVVGAATIGAGAAGRVGGKAIAGTALARSGTLAGKAFGSAGKALPFGSEVLGLTGASSLVDGRIPTAQDFADNALMLFTLKGFHRASDRAINEINRRTIDKLYNIFVKEGKSPQSAVQEAMRDPVKLQNLLADEQTQIKQGYEEVKENPLKGTREGKFDVLATIQNDLKNFIINRGAAIKNESGEIIVRGRELERETGTNRNFGFSKMIFGKGMTAEQMAQLPILIREYEPAEITERAEIYRIPNENGVPYKIVFNKDAGQAGKNVLVHMSLDEKSADKKMSKRRGPESQPPAIIQEEGYADASPVETSGPNLYKNSIAENAGAVKQGEGSLQNFNGRTRIAIPENKPVSAETEFKNENLVKKRNIISDLQKAVNVPLRLGKITGSKNVLGQYYPKAEMIRIRKANDLAVVAHEIGHHLEKVLFGKIGSGKVTAFYDELKDIATKAKSKNKAAVAAEGFAEFVAKYVVNPEEAKAKAPKFYDFFEKELPAKDPEMFKALMSAREQTRLWAEQPYLQEVLSSISMKPEERGLSTAEKWQVLKNKFAYEFVDRFSPVKRVVEQLEQKSGRKIDFARNPYYLSRMFPGWAGRAEAFLNNGAYDFKTLKTTGKSLKAILKPIKDLDEFIGYLTSKRVVELNDIKRVAEIPSIEEMKLFKELKNKKKSQGLTDSEEGTFKRIESKALNYIKVKAKIAAGEELGPDTGIRLKAAREVVKTLDEKYKSAAKELYEYQDALLKMQYDGGLIDLATYNKIKKLNENRVPFYRVMERTLNYSLGNKSLKSKQVVKRLKGSTRDIINPIEGIIKDTYETINAVERNRVGLALADLSRIDKSGEFVFKVKKDVSKAGETEEGPIFIAKDTINPENQIKVFRNGKSEIYEVDGDIAKIINGLNPSDAGTLVRGLGFFAKTLRAGATGYNLTFSIKNFMRDSLFAYLTSTSGFNPVTSLPGNVVMSIRKKDAYWAFMKAGGGMSGFVSMDRNSMQSNIRTLTRTGYLKSIWNAISEKRFAEAVDIGLLSPLRYVSETSEIVTRLGEFKSSMQGKDFTKENLERAGFNAREITLDFAKGGATAMQINIMSAFFNANIQGFVKTGEILKSRPNALKAVGLLGTLGVIEALASWDWTNNKEDEDIAEVNRAQKNINFLVKVDGVIYRVPKPQQIGFISTFFRDATIASLKKLNRQENDDLAADLAQAFWNEFNINPVPNAVSVPAEVVFNRSLFFNRAIVPAAAEGALPETQYTDNTTELTKAISEKLGGWVGNDISFSPAKAEHIVRGWTGGVGSFILQATDFALRKAGILPDPIKPKDTLADIPFVKAFVIRHPSGTAESIQKFYDKYESRMRYYNSFKLEGKNFNFEKQTRLISYAPYQSLQVYNKAMTDISSAIRNIYKNPGLNPDEKRQMIDALYLSKIQMAKAGLQAIKEIDRYVENLEKGAGYEIAGQ